MGGGVGGWEDGGVKCKSEAKYSVLRTYEVKQSKEMESFERSAMLASRARASQMHIDLLRISCKYVSMYVHTVPCTVFLHTYANIGHPGK